MLKRSFVLSKQKNNKNHHLVPIAKRQIPAEQYGQDDEDNIWDLCRELEELGGGIQTRLERISYLRLVKKPLTESHNVSLPPYLIIEDSMQSARSGVHYNQNGEAADDHQQNNTGGAASTIDLAADHAGNLAAISTRQL